MPDGTLRVKVVGDVADAQAKFGAFGGTIQKFAGYTVGAALGGAFAAMTKGALEMERAQGNFQAATGRSRDEAVQFSRDMNGLVGQAGTVGRTFEEIATVGTTVAQQFGITGEKARDLTADILAFSRVTGSDANVTAGQLEDTLTALGLSADDAAGFMDVLVASSQKYGTDVGPEQLAVLQQMAPALDILGASADDAVGLLNAFESAGVDSANAVKDLTAVVKNFPPGTSLNDVIAKLGAVEDPAARGRLAIELLGAKAGPALAKVIQPGMTSLDDLGVSASEAAGAVQDAAANMETTSDKIRGVFDKLLGGARDVGSQFGPLLSGLGGVASLAAPLAAAFKKMLITSVGLILPQAIANGTLTGAAQGQAQAVAQGEAAAGAGAIRSLFAKIAAMSIPLAPAGMTIGTAVGTAMSSGVIAGFTGAGLVLFIQDHLVGGFGGLPQMVRDQGHLIVQSYADGMSDALPGAFAAFDTAANQEWEKSKDPAAAQLAGRSAGNAYIDNLRVSAFQGQTAALIESERSENNAAYARLGLELGTSSGEGVVAGTAATQADVAAGYARMADAVRREWEANDLAKFTALGQESVTSLADGALSKSTVLTDGAAALAKILKDGLTPGQLAMQAIGRDYVTQVEAGLNSERIGAQDTARALAASAIKAISDAGLTGADGQKGLAAIGRYYVDLLNSGLNDREAAALLAGAGVSQSVIDGLQTHADQADNVANSFVDNFTRAIRNGRSDVIAAINYSFGRTMAGQSPPKEGPLHEIDHWGHNVATAWVESFAARLRTGVGEISATLGNMGAAAGTIGGAFGVATIPPHILGAGAATSSYTGGPMTVNVYGQEREDVVRQVERIRRREAIMWDLEPR